MDSIFPRIDRIIVQMDADVARKEKVVHCQSTNCEGISDQTWSGECIKLRQKDCKVQLPCLKYDYGTEGCIARLRKNLESIIGCEGDDRIKVTRYLKHSIIEYVEAAWIPRSVIYFGKRRSEELYEYLYSEKYNFGLRKHCFGRTGHIYYHTN